MSGIKVIEGRLEDNRVVADKPEKEIGADVSAGDVHVIKNVFPADEARRLRDLIFAWGQSQTASAQKDFYARTKENHFCVERGVSGIQKTLHFYHSYNLNDYTQIESVELRDLLMKFCAPLRTFYNAITGNESNFTGEKFLHPQVIHYPAGGGFFARHTHPLEPQRIGLLVSLSQRGVDFQRGGTGFDADGEITDIEPHHDAGDVGLFRFDLPHWVSPIDIEQAMDAESARGRWTLVLPYY